MENKYLKQIDEELNEFQNKEIQIVPGFGFNQKNIIDKIYRLFNSKFENGEIDADGDKKYFFNIIKNPCKVTTKAIDFDTKDIKILTAGGGDPLRTWWYERDLKFWMKDKNFGKVLNRMFQELPVFGSVVLKVIKGTPYFVDLRNFFVSPSADTLDDANYIIEKHLYSPQQFMKMGKKFGWDNLDKAMEEFRKMKDVDYINVYERYGEIAEGDEGKKTYSYKRIFLADVGIDEYDQNRNVIPYEGVVLKEEEIDRHPYYEFHLDKLPGRWLGVGVVEMLIDPQTRENEIANLQAKGSYYAALRLFQTRDQGINRNLMTDVRNGEVLKVDGEITQIDMSDRNLAFFNEETNKWLRNRDELSFSYDVVQGERLPAGTPLGSAKLAAGMTMSYFSQVQENIALDVKEFLYDVILPTFEKENTTEHILRLAGEDVDELNEMIINDKVFLSMVEYAGKNGKMPEKKDFELTKTAITEGVKQGKEKSITIPKDFYKDLKYKIDIVITGESQDPDNAAQVEFAALQAITADPTILQDPLKKKIFFGILEKQGIDISKFESIQPTDMSQLASQTPQKGSGGGVSAPVAMAPSPQQTKI